MFERAKEYLEKESGSNCDVFRGIISPVNNGYGEKKNLIAANHRVKMTQLAIDDISPHLDWLQCSDWESLQTGWTRTIDVLQHFRQELRTEFPTEPQPHLKLLCGSDLLETFAKPGLWADEDIQKIVANYGLVVMSRMNNNISDFINSKPVLFEHRDKIMIIRETIGGEDVSSTRIRTALSSGNKITFFVQPSVVRYIEAQSLYKTN